MNIYPLQIWNVKIVPQSNSSLEVREILKSEFLKFSSLTHYGVDDDLLSKYPPPKLYENSKLIDIQEIITSSVPIMINGQGGVGKTTIAKLIASHSIGINGCLPIMMTGRDIQENGQTMKKY